MSEVVFFEQVSTENKNDLNDSTEVAKTGPDPVAQTKGRYLVYILTQILRNNPKVSEMLNEVPNNSIVTRRKRAGTEKWQLSTDAKNRLQQTLLKASSRFSCPLRCGIVFGTNGLDQSVFGGDDFRNSLKEPRSPEHGRDALAEGDKSEPEQFSTEWFIESLWSLIGWDLFLDEK